MIVRTLLLGICLAGVGFAPLHARSATPGQQEALQWLQRVALAAKKLSYSGTFVYRNGSQTETSRIVHVAGDGGPMGKIEVLDGTPREVIRQKDEIACYLPETRTIIIEQQGSRRMFPALLPVGLAGLGEHYQIRKLGAARVAGFESQIVRLDPRDPWRYGRQFWVEQKTGLLLKAEVFDARGEVLESMLFTELRIGEPVSAEQLKPSVASREGWQIRQARLSELRDDGGWLFANELPGFRRQAAMVRMPAQGVVDGRETKHWVFSDGLAAISVFISPLRGGPPVTEEPGVRTQGITNTMKRRQADHLVVVMGDVPPEAIDHFMAGIGLRQK